MKNLTNRSIKLTIRAEIRRLQAYWGIDVDVRFHSGGGSNYHVKDKRIRFGIGGARHWATVGFSEPFKGLQPILAQHRLAKGKRAIRYLVRHEYAHVLETAFVNAPRFHGPSYQALYWRLLRD